MTSKNHNFAQMKTYPHEIERTMRPQMRQIRDVIRYHFARRHDGRGSQCTRNWIAEYRRVDHASGYSEAVNQIKATK